MTASDIGLYDGLTTTRAIRRFTDEAVSDEDLAAILFAATRAPSGSNRQPFRFLVLRDGAAEVRSLLGETFRSMWASMSKGQYARLTSDADPSSAAYRAGQAMQQFVDGFERIPVVVLPVFLPYRGTDLTSGASIYPACQNLLLAARARGLGGVLTMWHGAVEAELKALLGIPDEAVIAAVIPIGHPAGSHGPVRRRPLAELVHQDRWDAPAPWAVDPPGTRYTR